MFASSKFLSFAAFVVLLTLGACTTTAPDPYQVWQKWASENQPAPPNIQLGQVLPDRIAASTLYVDAVSADATRWEMYLDGNIVMQPSGTRLQGSVPLTDGNHTIRIVAITEVFPGDVAIQQFGPASASSDVQYGVFVDVTPPQFYNLLSVPSADGKSIVVSGTLVDSASGACCVSISGVRNAYNVDNTGNFSVMVPVESVGVLTSLSVTGVDKMSNKYVTSVSVTLPANRWERVTSDGSWVDVNTTPGFDPFNLQIVGILQVLKGYGDDYWIQYTNNVPGQPLREPEWWGEIKIGIVVVGVVIALVIVAFLVFQMTAVPRALAKQMSQSRSSTPTAMVPYGQPNQALFNKSEQALLTDRDKFNRLLMVALDLYFKAHPVEAEKFLEFVNGSDLGRRIQHHRAKLLEKKENK